MDFSIKRVQPETVRTACVVVPVYRNRKLSDAAQALDQASDGQLSRILRKSDFDSAPGSTLMLFEIPGVTSARVLLMGAGRNAKLDAKDFRKAAQSTLRKLVGSGITDATLFISELQITDRSSHWMTTQVATLAIEAAYRFDAMKSDPGSPARELQRVTLAAAGKSSQQGNFLDRGRAIGEGVNLARDLGNLPPNVCTPTYLAKQAVELGKRNRLRVNVLEEKDMAKLGMGSLLSVSQGSRQPETHLQEYRGESPKISRSSCRQRRHL